MGHLKSSDGEEGGQNSVPNLDCLNKAARKANDPQLRLAQDRAGRRGGRSIKPDCNEVKRSG